MKRRHERIWSRYIIDHLSNFLSQALNLLLHIVAFPYYTALKFNTLNLIEDIINENETQRRNALVKRFVRSKLNESKYVQVAI